VAGFVFGLVFWFGACFGLRLGCKKARKGLKRCKKVIKG